MKKLGVATNHFIIAGFILLFVTSCQESTPPDDESAKAVAVRTLTLAPKDWSQTVVAHGIITTYDDYDLSVDISATVKGVNFDAGQRVSAGDVLLVLDRAKLELQLESAMATVSEAKARLDQASAAHTRNSSVYGRGAISEQTFLQSEADLRSAKAKFEQARTKAAIERKNLRQATILSPITGTVKSRSVEPGQTVAPGATLGVLSGDNQLRVEGFISYRDVALLPIGARADITVSGINRSFIGSLIAINSSAEALTGNFKVYISLEDSDGVLREGMAVEAALKNTGQSRLMIPRSAVTDRNRQLVVFKVHQGFAKMVAPKLLEVNDAHYVVDEGLENGDEIVLDNLRLISDGQALEVLGGADVE